MGRLNLTLPDDTLVALGRDAKRAGRPVAAHARSLLKEALSRRAQLESRRTWAQAYRADRSDALELLVDLEPGQLDLLDDEEA